MKNIYIIMLIAVCAITFVIGCSNENDPAPVAVDNVTLDSTTLTLEIGEAEKLTATVTPDNAEYHSVTWSSSDTLVATVSNAGYRYGTVSAVNVGTVIITARAGDKTTTCEVTVKPISVKEFKLDKNALMPTPGKTEKLTAYLMPENAGDKTIKWSSSDKSVATVDSDGTVKAIKVGTAVITAQADGKTAECEVTVHEHSYSGGKCTVCEVSPYMQNGIINYNGELTKYSGNEAVVKIPDGVTSIGTSAFEECTSLKGVEIPDSVTSIGSSAFYKCTNLTSIKIPDGVTSIGSSAFSGCTDLASVTIGKGVTTLGSFAFYNCTSLTSVTIPGSVTRIVGNYAFSGCTKLEKVTISEGVTCIWTSAFSDCTSLKDITIPDSVTSVGNSAFYGCTNLASVTIGKGVTTIGSRAFYQCTSLTSVKIPDSVTSIGSNAFFDCLYLANIEIPGSVTEIGQYAFLYAIDDNSYIVKYGGTQEEWEKINRSKYDSKYNDGLSGKTINGKDGSTWTAK